MNFVLKPSLKHRALVKMAVSLWNQNDVRALMSLAKVHKYRGNFYPKYEEWKEIEARVLERVAQLSLPQLLKEKLSCFIQTIGLQIYILIEFHRRCYDLDLSLPLELCWTPQGTVDRKRTAEVLVKDESLDIVTRYKVACVYCLEDDVIALWNTLSKDLKQSFLSGNSPNREEWDEKWIITFWSRFVKRRRLGNAQAYFKSGFKECAIAGHKVAAEYFLQKLTPRERKVSLVEASKEVEDAEVLCFLLSEMEEEQQIEVFKDDPRRVLDCFLQWPWQSFFMEIANYMWDFLPKDHYDWLLREIIHKVENGYKDCNYRKLFRQFWQKSPAALKRLITNGIGESLLLPSLFDKKDKENIRFILQDATLAARDKLIYSFELIDFCRISILDDEWDFLEFCLRECFPSKDLMLKFKEEYEKRNKWDDIFGRNMHKWDKLFLSSDDSLREYEKRSADEGESSSSKRFRSLE